MNSIVLMLSLVFAHSACNVSRKLPEGQFLVKKVHVENADKTRIPSDDFEEFFRQKPNRKLFRMFQFFAWWYTRFDPKKIEKKRIARNERYDRKNAEKVRRFEQKNIRRAKKGKRPKVPRLKDKESPTLLESIRDIGEPPVVLDSMLTEQTRLQLKMFLFSKGYYNSEVTDSVCLNRRRKTARITYHLHPGKPYRIHDIEYAIEDSSLKALILRDTIHRSLRRGMRYDQERLQNERQRLTDLARNNGYYNFENAFISFGLDSSMSGEKVSVQIKVARFPRPYSTENDSVVYTDHTRFTLNEVFVITEPVIGNVRDAQFRDTLPMVTHRVKFLLNKPLPYHPQLLLNNIDLHGGQLFMKDTAQQTYRQLLGIGIFKNVVIQFHNAPGHPDKLDCYIICTPLIRQSITAETEGTNTSGNRGISGSIIYQNRNTFRGGELTELRLAGSLAAQTQLRVDESDPGSIGQLPRAFNTIQFGPELSFSVPRAVFPFSLLPFRRDMSPRTYIKSSVNYQARPDFSRVITSLDYGFSFKTHYNTLRHDIIPFEIYLVRAILSNRFKSTLNDLHDAFLVNSFQDHITTLSRYTVTYFSKENTNTSRRTVHYVRWGVQSSGGILRELFNVVGREKDSLGRYLLFDIPFAHFLRTDADYRIYIPVRRRSRMVYRIAAGIGKPLVNLNVLPYEQSFFTGGPNSVRAWRARTLGPGGYDPRTSESRYDKIGDILFEANVEYRFHIIKSFNGALFADFGNIWRLKPDVNKPRAEFEFNDFANEIAIGGGMGIRWDLNFFVFRLDLGIPLKDPKYAPEDRWTFDKRPWREVVANFGIGYPF